MKSSPDLPPPSVCTASAAILPRATLILNLSFWLLAMLLGLAFLLLFATLMAIIRGRPSYDLVLIAAGLATRYSLAALPLLLLLLPWALTAPSVRLRWLRLFTLQSLSLGGLITLSYVLAGGSGQGGLGAAAPLVGTVYFVAGLLAAMPVYWPYLRRLR